MEKFERKKMLSEILGGPCPECHSSNTHSCDAPEVVPSDLMVGASFLDIGSECEIAKRLDDICVGHCDTCGALWCLECGELLDALDKSFDEIEREVSMHRSKCGLDYMKVELIPFIAENANLPETECPLCHQSVGMGYSAVTKNPIIFDKLEEILGEDHTTRIICYVCIDVFKSKIKELLKDKKIEIIKANYPGESDLPTKIDSE